jgi:hemolysin D
MPYASVNSSSALPKEDKNEHQSYTQIEESADVEQTTEGNAKDLYYGTEELLDALPRLWTRGLFYVLLGFAVLVLPWSTLSKVDETGTARGRIEPQGATQKLDAQAGGSVKVVNVKEGDTVKAGQILLELESDILQTELQQVQTKLSGLQYQRSQLDILKNQLQLTLNVQEQQNQSQALEKISQVNQAKQNLDAKQSTYNLQKLEKQALVSQAQQQLKAV